jgi:hypothetical protein
MSRGLKLEMMTDLRYRDVCNWLFRQEIDEFNQRRHRENQAKRLPRTCDWLLSNSKYVSWFNGSVSPPIIWMRALPGCGKSILCSYVIHSISESEPTAAIAFHFNEFDLQYKDVDILRHLAFQLFERYWSSSDSVCEKIYNVSQKTFSVDNIKDMITILVETLSEMSLKSYFFLDGLDECEPVVWEEMLTFLIRLSEASPQSVRLWCSSQDRPWISSKLQRFILDVKDHVKDDVTYYISQRIDELDELEISPKQKEKIMENLKSRAEVNFLWASLMINMLTKEVVNPGQMDKVFGDLPSTLNGYYRRIFQRVEESRRPLARCAQTQSLQ